MLLFQNLPPASPDWTPGGPFIGWGVVGLLGAGGAGGPGLGLNKCCCWSIYWSGRAIRCNLNDV